jgi:Mitochondrial K+-H+ exchange-related
MRVFLIPVSSDRYELYCEVPEDDPHPESVEQAGFVKRTFLKLRTRLDAFEHAPSHGAQAPPRGLAGRILARFGRRLAETIAEQRLLWHLRKRTAATAVHPDDLDSSSVIPIVRRRVQQDFEKHRFWLVIDTVLLAASALLVLLPGPNLVAYYFAFRVVGHFLSIRGARQALGRVAWSVEPSSALSELRTLLQQDPVARRPRLEVVASALGLDHLPRFFDRVSAPAA